MKIEQDSSLISVYGVGTVKIQPNIIRILIELSHTSDTINEAQKVVNKEISLMLNIFNKFGIKKFYTTKLKFYPNYEWTEHKHILTGQKVEQNLVVVINDIKENIQKAKDLLDSITMEVDTIRCKVYFEIDNYEEKITEARNLAYGNALEKAQQYAKQANLTIKKAIKISEFEPRNNDDDDIYLGSPCMVCEPTTELPIGEEDIKVKLYCDFLAQ